MPISKTHFQRFQDQRRSRDLSDFCQEEYSAGHAASWLHLHTSFSQRCTSSFCSYPSSLWARWRRSARRLQMICDCVCCCSVCMRVQQSCSQRGQLQERDSPMTGCETDRESGKILNADCSKEGNGTLRIKQEVTALILSWLRKTVMRH